MIIFRKVLTDAFVNSQTKAVLKTLKALIYLNGSKSKTSLEQKTIDLIEEIIATSPLLTRSTTEFLNIVLEIQKNHEKIPISQIKEQAILAVGSLVSLLPKQEEIVLDKSITEILGPLNRDKKQLDYVTEFPLYIEALKNSDHPKCMEFMENIWNFTNSSKLTQSALHYLNRKFKTNLTTG